MRQQRLARQPQGGVVEHRVGRPGRGPGRVELVGLDGTDLGRVVARGLEHRPHELVPAHVALVGHVEHPGHPGRGQAADPDGQVGGERRVAPLVVHERQLGPVGQPQHGLDHVVAVLAAHPRRPHDRRPRGVGRDLVLAAQLGPAVHRLGVGPVPLDVGLVLGAVEHVVRRHVAEPGPDPAAGVGHPPGAQGVDPERGVGVGLAGVDGRVRARVQHHVGPQRRDRLVDGVPVADVERPVGAGDDLVALGLAVQVEVAAQLAARPRDQHPHVRRAPPAP